MVQAVNFLRDFRDRLSHFSLILPTFRHQHWHHDVTGATAGRRLRLCYGCRLKHGLRRLLVNGLKWRLLWREGILCGLLKGCRRLVMLKRSLENDLKLLNCRRCLNHKVSKYRHNPEMALKLYISSLAHFQDL